jgi:hypothetical protein
VGSMVRHESREVLKLASISQFLTRFSTREGRLPAAWLWVFAEARIQSGTLQKNVKITADITEKQKVSSRTS